jgi:hypothetical protein
MEWWLTVLGFVMSLLATADLAHKYGSALIKKILEKRSRPTSPLNEPVTSTKAYYLHAGPGRFQVTDSSVVLFKNSA